MLDIQSPTDYLASLRRRKNIVIVPLVLGIVLSVVAAFILPAIYRSFAVILIEAPEVPENLVSSTVTSYADERVQVISQRIMTTTNLVGIIEQFNLYSEKRQKDPIGLVVADMREKITLEMISAEVGNARRGGSATIAFTLAYDHPQPSLAQRVLNELVSLYLAANVRTRRQAAAETTEFLVSEADRYERDVEEIEAELTAFKLKHAGKLPEQQRIKLQLRDRHERELLDIRRQLQNLAERRIYLQSEFAQQDPYAFNDNVNLTPEARLQALRAEFLTLKSRYGPDHPDVRNTAREIKTLEREVGTGSSVTVLQGERDRIAAELIELKKRYSDAHPDVVRGQKELDSIEESLRSAARQGGGAGQPEAAPTNNAYIRLQAQLDALNFERTTLIQQQNTLLARLEQFEQELLEGPEIEREYNLLVRAHNNAISNFDEVKSKLTRAELGESLEAERKSEQFTLIEPANLPIEPISPQRLVILLVGLLGSLVVGGSLALLVEATDTRIYGARQLAMLIGVPPLVVVPKIMTPTDVRRQWSMRVLTAGGVLAVIVVALLTVQTYVMPLDVLWAVLEGRLDGFMIDIFPS